MNYFDPKSILRTSHQTVYIGHTYTVVNYKNVIFHEFFAWNLSTHMTTRTIIYEKCAHCETHKKPLRSVMGKK